MPTRIDPLKIGESPDPQVNQLIEFCQVAFGDPNMWGVIAHRPELVKTITPVFEEVFLRGKVEPHIHELMRIKAGEVNDCNYWATVRLLPVREQVEPKEVCILGPRIDESKLTRREALAVELSARLSRDPHTVDEKLFGELRQHFSQEEIVELVFAASLFNWGNKFNITMRMDTAPGGPYPTGLEYREVAPPA